MSLIDARLLDPAPSDVRIAAWTAGIMGSGFTPTDPFDGSTQARFDETMQTIAFIRPPVMFPGAIFRENQFRLVDDAVSHPAADGADSWAFRLQSFQGALIEGNLVNLEFTHPIHYLNSQEIKGFNNQRSNGVSLRISEDTSGGGSAFRVDDGLEDRIQDAITMSLL